MPTFSYTYNLVNGTTGKAAEVNQNFTDLKTYATTSCLQSDGTAGPNVFYRLVATRTSIPIAAGFIAYGPITWDSVSVTSVYVNTSGGLIYLPGPAQYMLTYRVAFSSPPSGSTTHLYLAGASHATSAVMNLDNTSMSLTALISQASASTQTVTCNLLWNSPANGTNITGSLIVSKVTF